VGIEDVCLLPHTLAPPSRPRADAVDQAAVLEAVARSAATGLPVQPPPPAAGPVSSSGRPEPLAGSSDAD
jgi:hypothetical protein